MPTKKKAKNKKNPFANIKKGALRAKLKTPKGKNIPVSALNKAAKSKNPLTRKQAVLAKNFRKMNRGR
jgi:hypothetical protein